MRVRRAVLATILATVAIVGVAVPAQAAEGVSSDCRPVDLPFPTPGYTITVGPRSFRVPSVSGAFLCYETTGTHIPVPFAYSCGTDCAVVGVQGTDYLAVGLWVCAGPSGEIAGYFDCGPAADPIHVDLTGDPEVCVSVGLSSSPPTCEVMIGP